MVLFRVAAVLAVVAVAKDAKKDDKKEKKKCTEGTLRGAVTNLCQEFFPDASADKIWFVKFYAPWCGHCQQMKPAWETLAKEYKNDPDIGIGGVNCDADKNKQLCGRFGVQGFPTIKAVVAGKPKNYNGGRDLPSLKAYVAKLKEKKGSKGGSSKCSKGAFKSSVKDSVLPLCSKHFPDEKSKNSWVVVYYNKENIEVKDDVNRLALQLGNEPVDKSKALKKNKKQKVLVSEFVETHELKGELKKKGKTTQEPVVKFGGVCCDCDTEPDALCKDKDVATAPVFEVFNNENKATVPFKGTFELGLMAEFIFKKLGYLEDAKEEL